MPAPYNFPPPQLFPDAGYISPTDIYNTTDPTDTLNAVIGPGEQPAGPGWTAVFNTIWPGQGYTNVGCDAIQLAYVSLPGDANRDGTVDVNDLTIVLAHYGRTGMTWSRASSPGAARWTSTT